MGHDHRYDGKHDAYYHDDKDEWREPVCSDATCGFCKDRPERPSESIRNRLDEILDEMTFPPRRRTDFGWLRRNLGIYNLDHLRLDEAMFCIRELERLKT